MTIKVKKGWKKTKINKWKTNNFKKSGKQHKLKSPMENNQKSKDAATASANKHATQQTFNTRLV